ncbi:hypothetical protein MmmBen468_0344 [Mycoplasma mycoides subsp. mycoides]|uniref:Uncharacterized protein n=2 Tax=Mycoplasma mycoides subsp. mycoides TaxID=2103 RepID=A0AAE2EJA9_MYCMY|nr:conserved hypothetical protein [Mycoplasma mycoides subsp. mycoides SC str. Gladysdale]AIZ55167.1 hypothetical protein mycmycITA_00339 [Mycoplasma mycoides subsp. mycoides]BCU84227.1 hypothetical protein mmcaprivi_06060 [Mycoplasma mycoides]AME14573.1 hypothetical protein MmmBen468_0344 [Mycoplasma mycoides subsp. mycoides]AMK56819.1 hypothetical protein MSCT144_09280 [Mycoplasma mycoides subsp. mycoides]
MLLVEIHIAMKNENKTIIKQANKDHHCTDIGIEILLITSSLFNNIIGRKILLIVKIITNILKIFVIPKTYQIVCLYDPYFLT